MAQAVAEKDFMALNKAAVNRGIVNAKDQFQFRAKHDIRRKVCASVSYIFHMVAIGYSMIIHDFKIIELLSHSQTLWELPHQAI